MEKIILEGAGKKNSGHGGKKVFCMNDTIETKSDMNTYVNEIRGNKR